MGLPRRTVIGVRLGQAASGNIVALTGGVLTEVVDAARLHDFLQRLGLALDNVLELADLLFEVLLTLVVALRSVAEGSLGLLGKFAGGDGGLGVVAKGGDAG